MRVLIIGAGIGGLAAGIALRQKGWEVDVFERTPEIREVGAGITLWTNAVKVLRKLGVGSAVEAASSPLRESEMRTWQGKLLISTHLGVIGEKLGAPNLGIHRADLQQILADAFGRERIHLGCDLVSYSQKTEEVTASFSNGREAQGAVLIGADGIKSQIRQQLLGNEPLRFAGYAAWRGVGHVDCPEVPYGLNLLMIGRGAQAGILPIGSGRMYWFATINTPMSTGEPRDAHKIALMAKFRDWYRPLPAVIEATPESGIIRNDIFDRPPVRKWSEARVTLLGDAAHSTTPNLGQGACQAIESAWVLAEHLKIDSDIATALRRYEQARFDRTAFVTNQSWSMGKMLTAESRFMCGLRNLAMRLMSGRVKRDIENLISVEV